jgi:hypothetical protein
VKWLPHLAEVEVRVLDDAEPVAERVPHRRHFDAATHVFDGLVDLCSQTREPSQLGSGVRDLPQYTCTPARRGSPSGSNPSSNPPTENPT